AADDAVVRFYFSDREHAGAAARAVPCRPGALVRPGSARHHAQGHRARLPVVGDAGAGVHGAVSPDREHAVVSRTAGVMGIRRILFLARAEVLHVVRDRATLAQVLIVPIVQLLILSNAATFQILNTATYVVDLDRTTASRGLVTRFAASGHF